MWDALQTIKKYVKLLYIVYMSSHLSVALNRKYIIISQDVVIIVT